MLKTLALRAEYGLRRLGSGLARSDAALLAAQFGDPGDACRTRRLATFRVQSVAPPPFSQSLHTALALRRGHGTTRPNRGVVRTVRTVRKTICLSAHFEGNCEPIK